MKKIISQKCQRFGSHVFCVGEEIPAELIEPNRVSTLLKIGCIKTVDAPDEEPKVEVTIVEEVPPVEETPKPKPAKTTKATSKKKASK